MKVLSLKKQFIREGAHLRKIAMQTLFKRLDQAFEGAIAVDREARIVWINEKYVKLLGIEDASKALGKNVEEVIPNSLMREVVRTGEPILLDIMELGSEKLVVTRVPIIDVNGQVIGGIGFVLFDRVQYLKPMLTKFTQLQEELAQVKTQLADGRYAKYTIASLVGRSPQALELKRQARRAAQTDATVLLLGETGTGKELLAHAIHAASTRANGPFIATNVAAIPDTLLEAEFFGVAPGAYTGAEKKGRDGKFKLAHGGTLFLDEIGDMPMPVQAKLLRVLQEHEFEPLGSNRVQRSDVRIIAATSVNLEQAVKDNRFRSDLYYRLNVIVISSPLLRERQLDMEALCEHLLQQISGRTGTPPRTISPEAFALLRAHSWPGNIRELRNVLEQAVFFTKRKRLEPSDFSKLLPSDLPATSSPNTPLQPLGDIVQDAERRALIAALAASKGNKSMAAQMLGVSRTTFYEKLERHGL
jgi:transcriptional regulator with PAS, ATPase and Fis domain